MKPPLDIHYTGEAISEIDDIGSFIAQDNPIAAAKVLAAIGDAVSLVSQFPEKSRRTRRRELRAVVLSHYPYIVFFRIRPTRVEIVHVLHGARRHPGFQEEAAAFVR